MTGAMLENVRPGWRHLTARQCRAGNSASGEAGRLAGHPVSAVPEPPGNRVPGAGSAALPSRTPASRVGSGLMAEAAAVYMSILSSQATSAERER